MEQKARQFWWGSGDKSGINWLAWDKVKKAKELGGVGFRDMETFNKALLAKQSWRLLINPHSLVARIMRHKYYREEANILNAKLGNNPSYAWRSVVAGIEVLKKGIVKKLGNGGSTNLFTDPWIHRSSSFTVFSTSVPLAEKLVCNYVIDGSWDIGKLNTVLWPVDVADISRMAVPMIDSNREDTWSWFYEDHRNYTVKSGYNLIQASSKDQTTVNSSHSTKYKWTKALWKLKMPKKICYLIWRIARSILPTRQALKRRKILNEDRCPFCDKTETSYHIIFQCKFAKKFCSGYLPSLPDNGVHNDAEANGYWISKIFNTIKAEDRRRFCVGVWAVWNFRNDKVFRGINQPIQMVIDRAKLACLEFEKSANSGREPDLDSATNSDSTARTAAQFSSDTAGEATVQDSNEASDTNSVIVYFDGAWRYGQKQAGGGVAIFNSDQELIWAKAQNFRWGNRAKEIEALALEMGIDAAIEMGSLNVTVKGDAEILLKQIGGRLDNSFSDRSPIQDIIDRIMVKAAKFSSIHWNWVPRAQNVRAHKLAEVGLSLLDCQIWTSNWPPWLSSPDFGCSSRSPVG